jgi:hypothetical protein
MRRSQTEKTVNPTVVKPKILTSSTRVIDTQTAANDNPATSEISVKVKKKRRKPTLIQSKPLKFNLPPNKQLSRKDFLKNRPINANSYNSEISDSLKMYVSPEEEMLTESTSEAETDPSAPAQG